MRWSEVPSMTSGAARRVSTPDARRAVLATFGSPHWTAPVRDAPGLLSHRRHECELRVRTASAVVCSVAFHTASDPTRPRPARVRAAPTRRRRRGGAGTV